MVYSFLASQNKYKAITMSSNLKHNDSTFLNNNIICLTHSAAVDSFNKFLANHACSSWDNKIICASNFLKLPISDCLLDGSITLLDNTNAFNLGHQTLRDFITQGFKNHGLNQDWDKWTYNVKAMLYKIKFGINSDSAKDVYLQIQDTTNKLGRLPVSILEFNYAKDRIIRQQFDDNNVRHEKTVNEMSVKIKTLMSQLNKEQQEKLAVITKLDNALLQINYLKAELKGFNGQSNDINEYVEAKLYNELLQELEGLKLDHADAISVYLEKINELSITSKDQKSQIAQLISKLSERDGKIQNNTAQASTVELIQVIQLNDEVRSLKKKVIDLLKSNIYKEKLLQKHITISETRSKITDLLKERNLEIIAEANSTKKTSHKIQNTRLKSAIKSIFSSIQK